MSRPSEKPSTGLARLQQLNELCNRFEAAWKANPRPRLEEFLAAPADPSLVKQLVLLDIDYRRHHDESPVPEDYLERFPALERAWLVAALDDPPGRDGTTGTGTDASPPRLPAAVFLDRLATHGLLPEEELRALRDRSQVTSLEMADWIARQLVAEGKLAEHQARALAGPVAVPLVLGPYLLDGWIASGGMGDVFRATHRKMKRVVAIKVMHGGRLARPEYRERFQREVEVAGRLRHPNVITAFDAGEQEGVCYLVTEFVEGEDLGRLVQREGPLPPVRAVECVRQAALGLGYAHGRGIIHRDVKPSNLILGKDGLVRVLDVGLARSEATRRGSSTAPGGVPRAPDLTSPGGLMGTVDYMAPEQADDPSKADAQSDVYSLGCTLFYLLTGSPPYPGEGTYTRLMAHRAAPVPSPNTTLPRLNRVVQRMMAKKPDDRPSDMAAVTRALHAVSGKPSRRAAVLLGASVVLGGVGYYIGVRRRVRPALARAPFDARAEQARWAEWLGMPASLENGAGMRMVLIPPGIFRMGTPDEGIRKQLAEVIHPREGPLLVSEKQIEVTIPEPYYLGATEVTVGQFRQFVRATGYRTLAERAPRDEEGGWGWHAKDGWRRKKGCSWENFDQFELTSDHPVGNVSWGDTQHYCQWLTAKVGEVCRLPTEAEWELACRAGSEGLWCFGEDAAHLPLYAHGGKEQTGPQRVGSKRPNALGLYDMHGNMREWCEAPPEAERPSAEVIGPGAPTYQPQRGGMFNSVPTAMRSAARFWGDPHEMGPGFRVLQVVLVSK